FGMRELVRAGDGLRGFVGFEAQVKFLLPRGPGVVPQATIAKHQIVVRLQVLGVHLERVLVLLEGFAVTALEEKHSAYLVANHSVQGILGLRLRELIVSGRVIPVSLKHEACEVMRAGEAWIELERLRERRLRSV